MDVGWIFLGLYLVIVPCVWYLTIPHSNSDELYEKCKADANDFSMSTCHLKQSSRYMDKSIHNLQFGVMNILIVLVLTKEV